MTTRLLLLTPHFAPERGGVPRLLTTIVNHSDVRDFEWRVITTASLPRRAHTSEVPDSVRRDDRDHRRNRDDLANIVTRASSTRDLVRHAIGQPAWLRRGTADRVVCGHPYFTPVAAAVGARLRIPVVSLAYGRELVPTRLVHHGALAALRTSRTVVTISERSAEEVAARNVARRRIAIVHPTLPTAWPSIRPAARALDEPLRLVHISRLAEGYKNFELTIRAAGILGRRNAIESLTIVGDGPRRASLVALARATGSDPYIRFVGSIDDDRLSKLLRRMHLGVFPSRESIAEGGFEGFGLVVHELAASGVPVVAGAVAGTLDALDPAWSIGLDPDDLFAWVRTIEQLGTDESRRAAMVEAGLAFGASINCADTARAYCEAIAA